MNFIRLALFAVFPLTLTAQNLSAEEATSGWATPERIRATMERSRKLPNNSGAVDYSGGAAALSQILGIPADSPEILRVVRGQGQPTQMANLGESKIIRHLQFNHGVAITPKDKIPKPNLLPVVDSLRKQAQTHIHENISKAQRASVEQSLAPIDLPSCETSETINSGRYEKNSRGVDKTVLMDVLTMRQDPPVDADEAFGKNTQILKFTTNKEDLVSSLLGQAGVKCLPYRLRLVGNQRFLHYGLDALKNYDNNPLGKGELSDFIKKNERSYR